MKKIPNNQNAGVNQGRDFEPEKLVIFTDGGSRGNPGPAAAAVVVKDVAGKVRLLRGKYLGEGTNNFAEYQGVILAYEAVTEKMEGDLTKYSLSFNLDSTLVVNQLNGLFKVKDSAIREAILKIRNFESKFAEVSYKYIPREQNKDADGVVNETLNKHLI